MIRLHVTQWKRMDFGHSDADGSSADHELSGVLVIDGLGYRRSL